MSTVKAIMRLFGNAYPADRAAKRQRFPDPNATIVWSQTKRLSGRKMANPRQETSLFSPTVFVVDDDAMVRRAMAALLESEGYNVQAYPSAIDFLDAYDPDEPGCLLLDVKMPEFDGLQLQNLLEEMDLSIPIIFLTGYAEVAITIQAFRKGAFDFIEKPVTEEMLLTRIDKALAKDAHDRLESKKRATAQKRLNRLTPRERDIMRLLTTGYSISKWPRN